jgi:hypothetical protein
MIILKLAFNITRSCDVYESHQHLILVEGVGGDGNIPSHKTIS